MNIRVSKKILHDCGKLKYSYTQLSKAFNKYFIHLRKVGNMSLYYKIMRQAVYNSAGPLPIASINKLNDTILKYEDYPDF